MRIKNGYSQCSCWCICSFIVGQRVWLFYGAETRHQGTPTPRIYPLLLLAVGRKHTAPRFRSPRIYPLLLLAAGCKHTAPRFHSPRVYPLLLLAVGRKHTAPRLPTPQVGSVFRPRQHPTTPLDAQETASKSIVTSSLSPSGTVLFLPHRHIRYAYIRCFPYRQAAAYRVSSAPP